MKRLPLFLASFLLVSSALADFIIYDPGDGVIQNQFDNLALGGNNSVWIDTNVQFKIVNNTTNVLAFVDASFTNTVVNTNTISISTNVTIPITSVVLASLNQMQLTHLKADLLKIAENGTIEFFREIGAIATNAVIITAGTDLIVYTGLVAEARADLTPTNSVLDNKLLRFRWWTEALLRSNGRVDGSTFHEDVE